MSRCSDRGRRGVAIAALVLGAIAGTGTASFAATPAKPSAAPGAQATYGFGKPASKEEIAGWDIDVRPDGAGLPPGRGTVAQGQDLYDAKCASCHGTFGESTDYLPLSGGVGTLASDQPVRTIASKLNFATTLWDYINRAMPFNAPKSLTADEVYALTAYVLNLSDLLPADGALDRASLIAFRMPNRDGNTLDHGMMSVRGKPDTRNVACMKDCAATVTLSSEYPEYALDSHGNLAEQSRALGPVEGLAKGQKVAKAAAPAAAAPADLAKAGGCLACHSPTQKLVGPAFRDVAAKYAQDKGAEARLVEKVRQGGSGAWGTVPMPPNPAIKEADLKAVVAWILGGAR